MSIQIIDKSAGHYRMIETIGSSGDEVEISGLLVVGQARISELTGQSELNLVNEDEKIFVEEYFSNIRDLRLVGPEMLLGRIFNEIGFNRIREDLFRQLVITRLVYPVSKLKTCDYLQKYRGISLSVQQVYRYLDKLHKKQMGLVQQISFDHTQKVLGQEISVVFYDVTTLYFEAQDEDDIRKTGFSKDGKHQHPQIVLGLLVSRGGYPLSYEIFEGNKFEGHTLLPVIEAFKKKLTLTEIVVVADSGLMSEKNIAALEEQKHQYIIGARIKTLSAHLKKVITELKFLDGENTELELTNGRRLIINFSTSRAKKDAHNRQRGIEKLKRSISSGKLSKKHINNKGYNKFLKLKGDVYIDLDTSKIEADKIWDGLKGYITNTNLTMTQVLENYGELWHIEKAFRISKTDLKIRPIYHHLKKRIEAHICIAFTAYKIYKELERQLKERQSKLSPEKTIDILKTINALTIQTPFSQNLHTKLVLTNDEQVDLINMFQLNWVS